MDHSYTNSPPFESSESEAKLTSGTPQQAGDLRQQAIAIQCAIGCSSAGLAGLVGSSSGDEDDTEDLPL